MNYLSNISLKAASKIISVQESGLSNIRFMQDTATGLVPKAVFARSKEDLSENTFLELSESVLVYYCPAGLGNIYKKIFSKGLPQNLKSQISTPAAKIVKNKKLFFPVKAAIALGALAIPLAEFTLNYIKNLMTLKVFKKGNFESIANLNTNNEDKEINLKIEKNAKKNIKKAVKIYAGCIGTAALLASKGRKSRMLQKISEFILMPGTKLFKNKKKADFVNKYFSLDFADNNGKLALSKGQLTSCVLIGGAGYFNAAKDRGKQNFLETLFRFPIVGFYIICGNELLEKGFRKLLYKTGKCRRLINENLEVPKLKDIQKIQKYNKNLYRKLLKQKCIISGFPLLFGIGIMGFFIAATSNLFTKYRYNKEQKIKA